MEDDLVESPEDLLVNLHPVFNVAEVELAPNITTVTIRDTDGMSSMNILSLVIKIRDTNRFFAHVFAQVPFNIMILIINFVDVMLLFAAVRVGFRLSTYSINEMDGQITITIERQDNLATDHGFTIRLSISSVSNATNGM